MRFSRTSIAVLAVAVLSATLMSPAAAEQALRVGSVSTSKPVAGERVASTAHSTSASPLGSRPGRADRAESPAGMDLSCPGGRVDRIVDCPEVVCPCQRGRNVVLARAHDPRTGCCNVSSCDRICSERTRCPRFSCPCGVPGDLAAATDDATGKCITDQREVCRRACRP